MTVKISVCEFGDDIYAILNNRVAPVEPTVPIVEQTQLSVTTSAASAAFNAKTSVVRLCADTACYISFGTAPAATANNRRIPPNVACYFKVPIGAGYKVACYDGTT